MRGLRPAARHRQHCVTRALRGSFLKSTAMTGGVLAALIAAQQSAQAACAVTSNPNTVNCTADTTTTQTQNSDAAQPVSSDQIQTFNFGQAVTGSVSGGVTVNGFGLYIQNNQSGTDGGITFDNFGTVAPNDPAANHALRIEGTTLTVTNSGTVAGFGSNGDGLRATGSDTVSITNTGTVSGVFAIDAATTGSSGITVTNSGSVTGTSAAGFGVFFSSHDGDATFNMTGGTVTAPVGGGTFIQSTGSGNVIADLTGGTISAASNSSVALQLVTNTGSGLLTIGPAATVSTTGIGSTALWWQSGGGGTLNALVLGTLSATGTNATAARLDNAGTLTVGNGGTSGTIVGNVQLNDTSARLVFNRSDAITYGGVISGTGTVEAAGGTINLTGVNIYTGVTAVDSGATLALKNSGSITQSSILFLPCGCGGAATFDISQTTSGATVAALSDILGIGSVALGAQMLTLTNGGSFNGVISDGGIGGGTGGSIVLGNGGITTFGGTNTYTGTTTINSGGELDLTGTGSIASSSKLTNNGVFDISNLTNGGTTIVSLAGNGSVTLGSNNLTLTNAADTFSGVIGGNGALILNGGTQTLSGANTYTGGTTINAGGTLTLGDATNTGSIVGPVTNNATFEIVNADTSGIISITNNAFTNFRNATSAGNATITNNNVVTFFDSSSAGSATITNNGGITQFNDTGTAGNATINNGAGSQVVFNNSSTAGNATIVGPGIVNFSDSSTAGSADITSSVVNFFNSSTAGSSHITNNSAVQFFNSSTAGTATITGVGELEMFGTGTLVLSGAYSYTGATNVFSGTLEVDSSIATSSLTTVVNGARLTGTGTVGNTTVQSGGTLMPGTAGAPGTLSVTGALGLNGGSTYLVQGSPGATFARTNVSGSTTIGANSVATINFANGKYTPGTYTILNSTGGVFGMFATFTTTGSFTGVRNPHLIYDANDVFLVLDFATINILSSFTRNQQAVAGGINNAINGGANPNDSFNTLLGFAGGQLTNALTQLTGTAPGGATTAGQQLMKGFLGLMSHPSGGVPQGAPGAFGGPIGYAAEQGLPRDVAEAYAAAMPVKAAPATVTPFSSRWSTWAAAYGGTAHINGQADVGTADTNARAYAIAGGAEYKFSPNTVLGFALAGGGTSWSLSQGLGTGAGDAFQIGGYATHNWGPAYVSGAIAYAWHDMHTDRTITGVGTEQLHAGFHAQGFGGRIESGYRLANAWVNVTPYGALQVQTFRTPAYSEVAQSGAGAFALSYNSRNTTATRTELGAWLDKPFMLAPDRLLSLRGRVAWAHDHSSEPGLNAVFQTLPGSNFTVGTTSGPRDLALVSAGAELKLASNWTVGGKFDGEFSGRSQSYAGTGVIKRVW